MIILNIAILLYLLFEILKFYFKYLLSIIELSGHKRIDNPAPRLSSLVRTRYHA